MVFFVVFVYLPFGFKLVNKDQIWDGVKGFLTIRHTGQRMYVYVKIVSEFNFNTDRCC